MSGDAEAIVEATVDGLGYECVDFERSARGLLRVFIDKTDGISVEDCAIVSNQLSRVFLVEGIDFDRLEVSSPGLDRPLKRLADFQRFIGQSAKVKLHSRIGDRKRFDGVIRSVGEDGITFALVEAPVAPAPDNTKSPKTIGKAAKGKHKASEKPSEAKLITVPLENIDRARLIPEI